MTDPLQTKERIDTLTTLATTITVEDAEALVREIERTEAFTPIFDPTWYQKHGKHIQDHLDLARAFLAFRREIDRLARAGEP